VFFEVFEDVLSNVLLEAHPGIWCGHDGRRLGYNSLG